MGSEAALVRAIRRAMRGHTYRHEFMAAEMESSTDNLVSFWVTDIHDFARRLVSEGVIVNEQEAA